MKPLIEFALHLGYALAKSAAQSSSKMILTCVQECATVIYELTEIELSTTHTPAQKDEAAKDAVAFFATMWQVLKQKGLLLAEDIPNLMALAAWQEIKVSIGV